MFFMRLAKRTTSAFNLSLIGILLISVVCIVPLSTLISNVSAQPTTILTPKWSRSGLGSNWETGCVIGDVTGDGQEDVVAQTRYMC